MNAIVGKPQGWGRVASSLSSTVLFVWLLIATISVSMCVFSRVTAAFRKASPVGTIAPGYALICEIAVFVAVATTLTYMRHIDKLSIRELIGGSRPIFRNLAIGIGAGLSTLAVIIGIQIASGGVILRRETMPLSLLLSSGAIWAVCFLLTGICEEAVFRGYLLQRIQTGFGFWTAVVVSSVLFAVAHIANSGEHLLGIIACFVYAVLFALLVRLSGAIWGAVGFHAAWDWAETFLFGCPNSGIVGNGHVFHTTPQGAEWVSGGSVGPEGSAPALLVAAVLISVALWRLYRCAGSDNTSGSNRDILSGQGSGAV
jgi:hypothetical protein